jgi:hypothetical protein
VWTDAARRGASVMAYTAGAGFMLSTLLGSTEPGWRISPRAEFLIRRPTVLRPRIELAKVFTPVNGLFRDMAANYI